MGIRFIASDVSDGCELSCWFLELNLGILQQQPMFLTAGTSIHQEALELIKQLFSMSTQNTKLLRVSKGNDSSKVHNFNEIQPKF